MPEIIDNLINYIQGIKLKRTLEKLARYEYEHARGTAHYRMLYPPYKRIKEKIYRLEQEIKDAETEANNLNQQKLARFRQVLEQYIALNLLTEVPGIGPKLSANITNTVFRGKLRDLQNAYRVPGVGENRQLAINLWIKRYEDFLPRMMEGDFPGKAEITKDIQNQLTILKNKIDENNQSIKLLRERVQRIEQELTWLQKVKVEDFIVARLDPNIENHLLEHYQQGVFPEWEPMPAWFKQILEEGS